MLAILMTGLNGPGNRACSVHTYLGDLSMPTHLFYRQCASKIGKHMAFESLSSLLELEELNEHPVPPNLPATSTQLRASPAQATASWKRAL